jgi:glyoxylate reductase
MTYRVFISRRLPQEALDIVSRVAEIDLWEGDTPPPRAELARRIAAADGLLCLLTDRIDGELLDGAPKLKVVSQMAVGYDNIDVPACTARGVKVGNTPGVLTETTADLAFALILAAARRVVQADNELRAGEWKTWSPLQWTGVDVHGATLGIVGLGRIGYEVARRARGFDMKVIYCNRSRYEAAERDFGAERVDMDTLLAQSDFVSLHCPLTTETRHLFGMEQFKKMKRSAILINTARGPVVNQPELAQALNEGIIAGAGIDVFESEPVPLQDPLLQVAADRIVVLPHIGSASVKTRTKMAVLAAENLVAGIQGLPLPNPVNG